MTGVKYWLNLNVMNSRSYKIIFALLIFSVLAVLMLQAFWIRNFYIQKRDEFDKNVYAALEKVNEKLEERQNLKIIKDNMLHKAADEAAKKDVKILRKTDKSIRYTSSLNAVNKLHSQSIIKIETGGVGSVALANNDSVLKMNNMPGIFITHDTMLKTMTSPEIIIAQKTLTGNGPVKKSQITTSITINSNKIDTAEEKHVAIEKLMDKMITEIRIIDTDETNQDTLKHLIKQVLENKGIFTPFEFSLKKILNNNNVKIVSQSQKFDSLAPSFRSDLSANKIFSTHNFLFLQFPDAVTLVFNGMKNILLLSLLFSLSIILLFYYTMRLIFKQKRLSEVKNDFINNMTHELKTPIATISLAVDGLNNPQIKNDDERFYSYTAILKEENQKLNNHVERVLQMSLLDKGELKLQKKPLNVIELICQSINTYHLQIDKQHAIVRFNSPHAVVTIMADEFHLLAVFNNLLDNALKYSKENCSVYISIQKTSNAVVISFKDSGPGIDAELHKKIFEKFYRVQGGNLHDVKGFGLGLSYVKSIIENHDGSIELRSEKGKGSKFIIKLPAYEN